MMMKMNVRRRQQTSVAGRQTYALQVLGQRRCTTPAAAAHVTRHTPHATRHTPHATRYLRFSRIPVHKIEDLSAVMSHFRHTLSVAGRVT